jgi:hypothetical protein
MQVHDRRTCEKGAILHDNGDKTHQFGGLLVSLDKKRKLRKVPRQTMNHTEQSMPSIAITA